ncbi:MAG: hypothetical protein JJE39_05830, partial [Vicinamibacteria bacterium]|nr:hypothetical protein [Vicinamibacteria bacterium]
AVPALVYVPARFEASDRDWRLTALRYGIDTKVWDRSLVSRRLEQMARSDDWEFLDLTPALRSATGLFQGEPYFQFDGHWNALGHDTAARALVDFLARRSLLPCGGKAALEKVRLGPPRSSRPPQRDSGRRSRAPRSPPPFSFGLG